MGRMTGGAINIARYGFNNYMPAFDFTNVIVDLISSASSTYTQLLFNAGAAKLWLNNGAFFGATRLTYRYLRAHAGGRKLHSLATPVENHLASFKSAAKLREALLASALSETDFDARLYLMATVLVWNLHGQTQCRTGYNVGSFSNMVAPEIVGLTYRRHQKTTTRDGQKRVVHIQQPFLDDQWIPRKFPLALAKLTEMQSRLQSDGAFEMLASMATLAGPFVGMQINNTVARVAASMNCQGSIVITRLLARRAIFPGPGTRKLLHLGAPEANGRRLISSCTRKDELVCGAVFAELGEQWGPSAKRALDILEISHAHSDGFAEESIACEISANLHRTRQRNRADHWNRQMRDTFCVVLRELHFAERKLIWRALKRRNCFNIV